MLSLILGLEDLKQSKYHKEMIVWNIIKKSKYRNGKKKKYQAMRSLYAPFTSSLLHQSLLELNRDFCSLNAKLRAEESEKFDPGEDYHYAG